MKYSLLSISGIQRRRSEIIYIIPASADAAESCALVPRRLRKRALTGLLDTVIYIRRFEGCPDSAVEAVRDKVGSLVDGRLQSHAARVTAMILGGVVVAVLGILDFTLPDPLPLADELLMIIGGMACSAVGYWLRRETLPALREKARAALRRIDETEAEEDPLLSRLYRGIREKRAPQAEDAADLIEAESRWFVRHVDIREEVERGELDPRRVRALLDGIEGITHLKRLVRAEIRGAPRTRLKRLRRKAREKTDFSDDALTVYSEFVKSVRAYFRETGRDHV